MATSLAAHLHILLETLITATSPHEGDVRDNLDNATGGRRWTQGTGSGQADRVYRKSGTLAAAATDSYNTLAAGGLTDVYGQAIDLDELKALVVRCKTGSIKIDAPAANAIGIFSDPSDLVNIGAGQTVAFDFGAAGLDVTTNSKFDIVDLAGGSGSTYEIAFLGAQ